MKRDKRQEKSFDLWRNNNGHGTVEASTGWGKSQVGINIINFFLEKHPDIRVMIVVPSSALQSQWKELLSDVPILHIDVLIINTVIKNRYDVDLLILDEIHRYAAPSFSKIFEAVSYKMILGLTATFSRLDEKHKLIEKYCPIIDTVSFEECKKNKWVNTCKEYVVLVNVDNIDEYKKMSKEFNSHFEFFDHDFNVLKTLCTSWQAKVAYAKKICKNPSEYKNVLREVNLHTVGAMRALGERKTWIANHPDKLRVAEKIISMRGNEKIITFSSSVQMASSFSSGYVFVGNHNDGILQEFSSKESGCLHTCKLAETGLNLPDLSVGIMLGVNSSKTKHVQARGRIVRYVKGKKAEFFTIILNDTVELSWWERSGAEGVLIDENNLNNVLEGKKFQTYSLPLRKFHSYV